MNRRNFGRRQGKNGNSPRNKRQKKVVPIFEGRVQMTREGYIFVIIEGEADDVYVKASKTRGALNGDIVKVAVTHEKTGDRRREGEVLEIVTRSQRPFVGILHTVGNKAWVLMSSKVMPYDIAVPIPEATDGMPAPQRGMKVAAVIDGWDKGEPSPRGHIVDILGLPGENETEMHAILAEFGLPYRFEKEVENAADAISDAITPADLKERRDFRNTLTFTIDPADAKDFDDALSFRRLENGNYEVGVHIADVSHYVTPGTPVDKEAQARGTSVYLVDRTVPMLPEKLSNKLCSLRPGEEKLTFSAVFEITPLAKVASHWFGRTVINSDYRFAYETAQQIIDNGKASLDMDLRGGTDGKGKNLKDPKIGSEAAMGEGITEGCVIPRELKEAILILWDIAAKLRKKRFAAGAIGFDRPEMKVEVDEKGRPINVYEKISKEANWLIEEFMLLANRNVAEFIATAGKMGGKAVKSPKTFIYRIHDEPNGEKIGALREFAGSFGHTLGETGTPKETAKSLNSLLTEVKGRPEFSAIELLALRSMSKATYSTDNIGHYGLGFNFYTHFTSPIRRYPDTMVHRLLALYLSGADSQDKSYYSDQCKHAAEREIVAAEAERESIKYKLVEFMQDKVGAEFEGHISGLTDWGMYVEIEPTHIEGMVALRDIHSDFYEFDEERYLIKGRRTGTVYRLGDPVKIKVKNTNLEQKLLDYELVETGLEEKEPQDNKSARKAKISRSIKTSKAIKAAKARRGTSAPSKKEPAKPHKSSRAAKKK